MSRLFAVMVLLSILIMLSCTNTTGPAEEAGGQLPSGMNFATIPAGSFSMGAPEGEDGSGDFERPVHTVTINYSFEMMTTEVTRAMWYEVLYDSTQVSDPDLPKRVILEDLQEFTDNLNAIDPSHTYRLPSEAEWEYACRAGTTTRFYWGDDPDCDEAILYSWTLANSSCNRQPVALLIPNSWGLYDMSGNMWELCLDTWHDNYTSAPTDGSAWIDASEEYFVCRGGVYSNAVWRVRSAHRFKQNLNPYDRGFRLVRI